MATALAVVSSSQNRDFDLLKRKQLKVQEVCRPCYNLAPRLKREDKVVSGVDTRRLKCEQEKKHRTK